MKQCKESSRCYSKAAHLNPGSASHWADLALSLSLQTRLASPKSPAEASPKVASDLAEQLLKGRSLGETECDPPGVRISVLLCANLHACLLDSTQVSWVIESHGANSFTIVLANCLLECRISLKMVDSPIWLGITCLALMQQII